MCTESEEGKFSSWDYETTLEKRRNPPEKTVVRKLEDRKLSELGERRTNEKFPYIGTPARYGNEKRSSCTSPLFRAKRYFLFMEWNFSKHEIDLSSFAANFLDTWKDLFMKTHGKRRWSLEDIQCLYIYSYIIQKTLNNTFKKQNNK